MICIATTYFLFFYVFFINYFSRKTYSWPALALGEPQAAHLLRARAAGGPLTTPTHRCGVAIYRS